MILTNLSLNRGSLVRTRFVLFVCVLKSPFLVFLCLKCLHQQESNTNVVNSFQYFRARFEVWNFCAQFQKLFLWFSSIYSPTASPTTVNIPTTCPDALLWVVFSVLLIALVSKIHIPYFSFNVSMFGIPCLTSSGKMGWTVSAATSVLHRY